MGRFETDLTFLNNAVESRDLGSCFPNVSGNSVDDVWGRFRRKRLEEVIMERGEVEVASFKSRTRLFLLEAKREIESLSYVTN